MKVVVIGGGPAGCAAAYTLVKQGHDVRLIEASQSVGGRTKTLERDGFKLATGALFLMGGIYPRTSALLKEMGETHNIRDWKGAAQLHDNNDARYKVDFVSLPSYLKIPVLTWGDRLKVAWAGIKLLCSGGAKNAFNGTDLAKFDTGEDLEHWSRDNLGDRAYEYIVRPIMDFLYAVPASWLSTPFPLAIIQQAYKMRLSSPLGGVGKVSDWFVKHSPGLKLHLNAPVERLEQRNDQGFMVHAGGDVFEADGLVVATPAFVSAELLKNYICPEAAQILVDTPYTDYAHVAIGYKKSPWPDFESDIVLPVGYGETRNIGAVVLHSRRDPTSVPAGGELVGVYFNTPPLAHLSDDDICREAVEAAIRSFGPAPEPDFVHLFHYDRGLSIAKPGHYGKLDAIHAKLPKGVVLAGDYFSQAGVEAAVYSGERAAQVLGAGAKA